MRNDFVCDEGLQTFNFISLKLDQLGEMVWIIMRQPEGRASGGNQAAHSLNCFYINTFFFSLSPVFSVLFLSHVDIWEVSPPIPSLYPIWLLYSHIFMTHVDACWFLRPPVGRVLGCLFMSAARRDWMAAPSWLRRRVQQICSCHQNKRAAGRPLTARSRGGWCTRLDAVHPVHLERERSEPPPQAATCRVAAFPMVAHFVQVCSI